MRAAPLLLAAVLGVAALAGCLQKPAPAAAATAASAGASRDLLLALGADPKPALDGKRVMDWLQAFVTAHHPRVTGTPLEKAAGDDLEAQLAALGYQSSSRRYNAKGLPSVDGPLRAVLGVKKGTTHPEEIIVVGGHYDTSPAIGPPLVPGVKYGPGLTIYATYDNGSGTAMVMELARLLANVTTERTLVFALFNGEEEGTLASAAYANDLEASGARVVTYVGFDMVGINWPSKAGCLCIYAGRLHSADLNPVQEAVAFGFLHYPRGNATVQVFDNHDTRNSDEASFATAGFATMRWAGMARATDYWAYHQLNDTMDTMLAEAGGQDALVAGFESASASAYYTILAMDREGIPSPSS